MNQKIRIEIAVGFVAVVALAVGLFIWNESQEIKADVMVVSVDKKSAPVACPMEAKLCADGSYVSRTKPNCEFANCPDSKDETANWRKYTFDDINASFNYPENLSNPNNSGSTFRRFGFKDMTEEFISGKIIVYDKKVDSIGDWSIANQYAKDLLDNPTCDLLATYSNDISKVFISEIFKKPNICNFIKRDGEVIFYAIGKSVPFEDMPIIGSSVLVLTSDHAIILEGAIIPGINDELRSWNSDYIKNNPGIDYLNAKYKKFYKSTDDKIAEFIQKPSTEMQNRFNLLGKIADTVTIQK